MVLQGTPAALAAPASLSSIIVAAACAFRSYSLSGTTTSGTTAASSRENCAAHGVVTVTTVILAFNALRELDAAARGTLGRVRAVDGQEDVAVHMRRSALQGLVRAVMPDPIDCDH